MKRIINFAVIMVVMLISIGEVYGITAGPPDSRAKVMPRMQRDKAKAAAIKNREYQPTDAQLMAADEFRRRFGREELEVVWNPMTGLPGIGVIGLPGADKGIQLPNEGAIEEKVKIFLKENYDFFKIDVDNLKLLRVMNNYFGGTRVEYDQYYQGIPVERGGGGVNIRPKNVIDSIGSYYHPNINISVEAKISLEEAIEIVKEDYGPEVKGGPFWHHLPTLENKSAVLLIEPMDGEYYLAWKIWAQPVGYYINAYTGEIIKEFGTIDY